ncbi:MAG: argininosuccinate synthase [Methanoregulaceae archaeon]|nr:argininosuccinate synthase [Methanoregulaceae archaeon]
MKAFSIGTISLVMVILVFCCPGARALPTEDLVVSVYAPDGISVLNTTTLNIAWMEANLPVQGDGVTHYYHQGPVFVESKEGQWDRNETANFKDMGAVKGTAVRDMVGFVGGMEPGDEVMIKANDGYHVEFGYPNIYQPEPRQGNITVCWFNGDESKVGERQGTGYPPSYHVGMRLVFLADASTNAEGKHVFGNGDMHEVMPAEKIHLFDNLYPSTGGYTVKWVDEVRVYRGGYTGSADILPKSYESKMDETYPPPPTESPLPVSSVLAGFGLVVLLRRKIS